MGAEAGQLLYGIKISEEEAGKLTEKFNAEYFSHIELDGDIAVDTPYETEEYFIKIAGDAANFETYNFGIRLGSELPKTSPDWKSKISQFCKENDIEIDCDEIGWYLTGHYV